MLITIGTRRAVHLVAEPGAKPQRLEGIPLGAAQFHWSRDIVRPYVVYARDEGGGERFRFFRYDLKTGISTPLTTTPARAYAVGFDREGHRLAFFSNERNGTDSDIYVVDVEHPETKAMVYRGTGDYTVDRWTGDDRLLVSHATGMDRDALFLLNPTNGALEPVLKGPGASTRLVSVVADRNAPVMYLVADLDGEFASVHSLDLKTVKTTALTPDLRWDVAGVEALSDGHTLALLVNEEARYRLYLLDIEARKLRRVDSAPPGFPNRGSPHSPSTST